MITDHDRIIATIHRAHDALDWLQYYADVTKHGIVTGRDGSGNVSRESVARNAVQAIQRLLQYVYDLEDLFAERTHEMEWQKFVEWAQTPGEDSPYKEE